MVHQDRTHRSLGRGGFAFKTHQLNTPTIRRCFFYPELHGSESSHFALYFRGRSFPGQESGSWHTSASWRPCAIQNLRTKAFINTTDRKLATVQQQCSKNRILTVTLIVLCVCSEVATTVRRACVYHVDKRNTGGAPEKVSKPPPR